MSDPEEHVQGEPATPLEYARPMPGQRRNRAVGITVTVTLLSLGLLLAGSLFLPSLNGSRGAARVKCASNLKQISLAIAMYANDHGGRFPDDLDTLLETEDITTAVVTCPGSNDSPGVLPTSQPVGTRFLTPGHVSYIYLGKGLTTTSSTPDVVLVYEPLTNHSNAGMNVLFGDLHVEWMLPADAMTIQKQIAAGVFPIRLPPAAIRPSTQEAAPAK